MAARQPEAGVVAVFEEGMLLLMLLLGSKEAKEEEEDDNNFNFNFMVKERNDIIINGVNKRNMKQ